MSEKTMFGVVLTGHGGPEKLEWRDDLPRPEPGPGEVLVRVRASAVNNTDINTRVGWYSRKGNAAEDASWGGKPLRFPLIQGIDACGMVEDAGAGVDPDLIGKRVLVEPCIRQRNGRRLATPEYLGSEMDGAFAEYLVVPAVNAHPIDSPLSDEELATFPCSWSTAENMLSRAGAARGERVLVTGASGGVGSAAVQLAAARGCEVVAVSKPDKAPVLLDIGATEVIGRDEDPKTRFGEASFDLVVDLVGGPAFPTLLSVLRHRGRYAVAGAVGGPVVDLDLRDLYLKDLTLYGCTELDDGVFAGLVRWIESGQVRPLLARSYSLRDIRDAQEAFASKRHVGKIGLKIER
ncbi:NADPH:quinone reductase-like Zn-dependent oxidoreductase [Albidovulum inexpectatum]|uniref:NADPH:quinone reductase-like Zn-dependent oxidoreductase n=1 Tax=Albidovulum inexpectatum TaxID=196587 RepID=A0A2S5JED2_9RHOB|nr:alcohol dehydrogenase family protein [Albidovulum inexpectatum]PPB79823.1 NADPH:quinone reductase-like Zn-dependent oxidoreductase [Albidovulum inexpectatum]